MAAVERVAIVGMAGRFPGSGADLERFWANVRSGRDCSTEVPAGRWFVPPERCFDARLPHPDSVYSTRGYYLDPFTVDHSLFNFPAELLAELDPLFHLVLDVGSRAWRTTKTNLVNPRKAGVILGNICLPTEKSSDLAREILGGAYGLEPGCETHSWNRYVAGLPAGLLAKALGFGGASFTLDAACASSLYAIQLAAAELITKRADVMLAGGVSRPDCQYTQMGFAQLRALSTSGRCSPFDSAADGLVVGEGAGIFVLKRLSDALEQGDTIHAVICGAGLSNDVVGSLLAPAIEGQLRAMRAAYQQAGWTPNQVELIECHATGTPVGDAVEFDSLRELWNGTNYTPGQCVIGSVKSTVGHLLTGAGAAATMKVLLAMKAGERPPQANFRTPSQGIRLDDSPFRVLQSAEQWQPQGDNPRRAAVSGFGFGGVNAHLLLEQYIGQTYPARARIQRDDTGSMLASKLRAIQQKTNEPIIEEIDDELDDRIAIVGLAARCGPYASARTIQEQMLGNRVPIQQQPTAGWEATTKPVPSGFFINELEIPLDRFRIPPKELEEALPQQLLALQVAAAALDDCKGVRASTDQGDPRSGVFVGLGLDLNTTNFHVRWAVKQVNESFADAASPPLTANRVMGALGSIAASRIARAFRFGGPSFTVCSEETSASRAIELGVRALRTGQLDRAVVGGVELLSDPRALVGEAAQTTAGDGAAFFVLKRLNDAERDGDRVYAIIRGVGSAVGGSLAGSDAATYASSLLRACIDASVEPHTIGYLDGIDLPLERQAWDALHTGVPREHHLVVNSIKRQVGHTGFASGAVALVSAVAAVYQQLLPSSHGSQFWLTNTNDPPRRAVAAAVGCDGTSTHILVEEYASSMPTPERAQPLGARAEGVFVVDGDSTNELLDGLGRLFAWLPATDTPIERHAFEWYRRVPPHARRRLAVTLVARSTAELREQIEFAIRSLTTRSEVAIPDPKQPTMLASIRDRVFFNPYPLGRSGKVAFVFPGSGNHFAGMGRELGVQWPQILRNQHSENTLLRSQYRPDLFWADTLSAHATPRDFLFGQVTLGTLTSDLLVYLGVKPDAMIGQSLGESAGLFGLRIWTARDEMLKRIQNSTLFTSDLSAPYHAAMQHYGTSENLEWLLGVMPIPPDDVSPHLRPNLRAYLLIVNTQNECVIGGVKADVEKLVAAIGKPFLPVTGVTLAHCEAGKPVERPYRELHTLPVTVPPNLRVYSGAWGREYKLTEANAADSITAGLLTTIHFPNVVEAAYRDGVRLFVEVGPGGSCSRMIDTILGDRPHVARPICVVRQDSTSLTLRTLANLIAERVPIDWSNLYGHESVCVEHQVEETASLRRLLTIRTAAPARRPNFPNDLDDQFEHHETPSVRTPLPVPPDEPTPTPSSLKLSEAEQAVVQQWVQDEESGDEPDATPERTEELVSATPPPLSETPDTVPLHKLLKTPPPSVRAFDIPKPPPSAPTPLPIPLRELAHASQPVSSGIEPYVIAATEAQQATAAAHELFLQVQNALLQTAASTLALQQQLLQLRSLETPELRNEYAQPNLALATAVAQPAVKPTVTTVPRALTYEQCRTFAAGKIGEVLGPQFAAIDAHPTRVRLPDGPLMLVDRILSIEGEPKSMKSGRVVTDHTVHADRWYLDAGRCPISVTVEAGQADLFLSGFLGIDFETKGLAVYRLLDAVVTFHRELPRIGERIEYDIHIDEFFSQADAWLFRFRFEGTIDGQPLLSMKNGVAGFFTQAALEAGQGIIHTKLDKQPIPGVKPSDWKYLVPLSPLAIDRDGVEALRRGDLTAAFGADFAKAKLLSPMRLPGGMLRLVDRVSELNPTGGRFGLGFIRAEYDIQPKEWFIECHFVDDKVMPGTLMYECCQHTLRILLMRLGWVGEEGTVCEPVPGVNSRLKCRGQVLETTKTVTYEVSIKELGYRPEPFAIADALMYADGKPIVEITNLSLRMSGLSLANLQKIWPNEKATHSAVRTPIYDVKPAVYDSAKIMAYSNGKPSEGFGEPYRIFDQDRVIARLPGPPYQFLDRITAVHGEPFVLKAGASCEAQYDVPVDAWYFDANRCALMPFSVLLEIALQPCGWLAAYCGSALTSENDLSFRNLGGKATQFVAVTPSIGTLTTTVTMTQVSSSAGMIIQHYSMLVMAGSQKVYEGTTYFGFFGKEALANQVGMPTAKVPYLSEAEKTTPTKLPHDAPFPGPMLRMVDLIDGYLPNGGRKGLDSSRAASRSIRVSGSFRHTSTKTPCGLGPSVWSRSCNC